ncbi:SDR family NAD(P)-dependent oxidoreductase [Labilibacter marinus]|uniref:SDR family NAD(P)-dependent oxidoreductase n=1 Tax=Labilibacter marinus TaxID=1477105 RepID=UPI00082CD954|nr:SDR family NAD(P)-dependent oxidoreductase [Labilibacter marinus]
MKKTILITGSTDGIGKLTAVFLAKDGHEVILHGRNAEKLNAVVAEISEETGNDSIKGYVADFSDLESVKEMAGKVNGELAKIDVLINNAGVFKGPGTNEQGLDSRLVVNYLAPYVLTKGILPSLKKGNEARIVNLSSAAQSPVSMDALKGEESISVGEAYAQSKLALTMWSFYLAQKVPETSVIAVNPGSLLNTNMAKEAYGQFWSPADKGANILYELAVHENFKGITGKYFDNDQGNFGLAQQDAYNEAKIERLIKVTEEIVTD